MFVDTGGWIPPGDPPSRKQARAERPKLGLLRFLVLALASGLAVLLVSAIIVEGMIVITGR